MKKHLHILLLLLPLLAFGSVTPDSPFIHVEGKAKKWVKPDQVYISFDLVTSANSYQNSVKLNDEAFNAFLKFFEQESFPVTAIESYDLDIDAEQERWKENPVTIYTCERDVKITLDDLFRFPVLLDEINRTEQISRTYISFKSTKEDEIKEELLSQAISDGKKKASLICDKMGMKVKSVHAISDEHFININKRFVPQGNHSILASASDDSESRTYLMPERIGFTNWIYVIFTIEEKGSNQTGDDNSE